MLMATGAIRRHHPPLTISEIMHKAISDRVFPGGAVAFGSCTVPFYYRAFGTYTFESNSVVRNECMWDMASLTKVMVTTPSVMILFDRGMVDLDELAYKYLPEFGCNGKEVVTVRQLLTHTAGLREFYPFYDMGLTSKNEVLNYILDDQLHYPAGESARYSDLSMIILGLIVERISGFTLDVFSAKELFEPLGMRHTNFRPTEVSDFNFMVIPTEVDRLHRNRLLWGEVHDPTAFLLGGVAGNAGLFSTIVDVCRFAQMMLAGGIDVITNRRFFRESTVRRFVTQEIETTTNPRPFALGWDVASRRSADGYTSAGQVLGPATFGHTGFTGTSLWIDPDRDVFVALLSNAVHPTADGGFGAKVMEVRPMIADAAVFTLDEQAIPRRSLRWHVPPVAADGRRELRSGKPGNSSWNSMSIKGGEIVEETNHDSAGYTNGHKMLSRIATEETVPIQASSLSSLSDTVSTFDEPRTSSRAKALVPIFAIACVVSMMMS